MGNIGMHVRVSRKTLSGSQTMRAKQQQQKNPKYTHSKKEVTSWVTRLQFSEVEVMDERNYICVWGCVCVLFGWLVFLFSFFLFFFFFFFGT